LMDVIMCSQKLARTNEVITEDPATTVISDLQMVESQQLQLVHKLAALTLKLELGINWSAVADAWRLERSPWIQRVKLVTEVSQLSQLISFFRDHLVVYQDHWTEDKQILWKEQIKDSRSLHIAAQGLLEVEDMVPVQKFSLRFKNDRNTWLAEVMQLAEKPKVPSLTEQCLLYIAMNFSFFNSSTELLQIPEVLLHLLLEILVKINQLHCDYLVYFFSSALTELHLTSHYTLHDEFLRGIDRCTNLKIIDLSSTGIVRPIIQLPSLLVLNISETAVSDETIEILLKDNPNLSHLIAHNCRLLNEANLISTSLTVVDLLGCKNLSTITLHCPLLNTIDLRQTSIQSMTIHSSAFPLKILNSQICCF